MGRGAEEGWDPVIASNDIPSHGGNDYDEDETMTGGHGQSQEVHLSAFYYDFIGQLAYLIDNPHLGGQ